MAAIGEVLRRQDDTKVRAGRWAQVQVARWRASFIPRAQPAAHRAMAKWVGRDALISFWVLLFRSALPVIRPRWPYRGP
jgi:hypothetical protein